MMHWLKMFIRWHPYLSGAGVEMILNCAVTTLPTPDPNEDKFYRWFFNFSHALVLALPRIASQYQSKNGISPEKGS